MVATGGSGGSVAGWSGAEAASEPELPPVRISSLAHRDRSIVCGRRLALVIFCAGGAHRDRSIVCGWKVDLVIYRVVAGLSAGR